MTVAELIEVLKGYPQDIQVIYAKYSEHKLLEDIELYMSDYCQPRPDGWVQDNRPDMPTQKYLVFPGN